MALTFVGSANAHGDSVTGDYNVTLPAGTTTGDIVIVCTGIAATSNLNPGVTTSGYTEEADLYANDNNDANLSINWKIMGGTPDTTVTCIAPTAAGFAGSSCVHVWRGVDQTTPMDVAVTTATGINTYTPDSPSITPVTSGAVVLTLVGFTGGVADGTFTEPTGYSNPVVDGYDAGSNATMQSGIASKAWSGSGAEDPGVWTNINTGTEVNQSWAAATIALRPASAAATSLLFPPQTSGMQSLLAR